MAEDPIEQEIQSKGLTAPRMMPADIESAISSERYFTASDGAYGASMRAAALASPTATAAYDEATASLRLLTFCVLILRNGFTVTGESACASPENFDAEIGRKIARQKAVEKIWPLLGFRLRDQLAAGV